MESFEFATASRIVFGDGCIAQVPEIIRTLGQRPFFVTSGSADRLTPLLEGMAEGLEKGARFSFSGEPTVDLVREATELAATYRCDMVVGIGGGSVIDLGKAVSGLLPNGGDPMEYLEVIGGGKSLEKPSCPYVAIPTTAGTGAEVTRNAVLGVPEHRVKVSLRSPYLLPKVAVIDPELTHSMPPGLTGQTGMDALTQVIEPYISCSSNPFTDLFCVEGIVRAARSLRRAYSSPLDAAARSDMALVSLFGGLALANAKLGAVHGLAGPLGGRIDAPHGAICARLLPLVMRKNLAVLSKDRGGSKEHCRIHRVAQLLVGQEKVRVEEGIEWLEETCRFLQVPSLGSFGLTQSDLAPIAQQALRASSMRGNPVSLELPDLEEVLGLAL